MTHDKAASWAYSEDIAVEPELMAQARLEAAELGITSLSPATGQFLATLACMPQVSAIAEIGTGTGLCGLYMLSASKQAILTTIDVDLEAQNHARDFFTKAGVRTSRYRIINGRSADLLPRLAKESYDLVLLDGDPLEAEGDFYEAVRMLRTGGMVVIAHALNHDRVADPARRDEATVALRNLGHIAMESEEISCSLLPLGDGLLFGVKK
ncbi:putative O-methyltransferase YrrM [Arcanobacterium pluranimalium]|uniref:O-methyltransferase n=1 Tax=Arcanobacterium pluranimalium TaxID=108028 RepID=UPI0019577D53|nr:class I SAM-dependent methyltransferase [Arcanobacterium pluranimalium]MBM7825076.1 putative O-methyltransferase YrrM [Arcanobacterium pluranimalium]